MLPVIITDEDQGNEADVLGSGITWKAHALVRKYSPDQVTWLRGKLGGAEPTGQHLQHFLHAPEDGIAEDAGNILVTVGLNNLTAVLIGAGGTTLAHANSIVGVGTTATAANIADTALGSDNSANAYYQQADISNPTQANGVISNQSSFTGSNGNFAWNEWCWAVGTAGITPGTHLSAVATGVVMINHKVTSLGTKASGATWVFQTSVTLS